MRRLIIQVFALCLLFQSVVSIYAQNGDIEGKAVFEGRKMYWREQLRLTKDRLTKSNDDRFARIASDHTFRFDDVEPGAYYLASQDWEGAFVEVKPGETTSIEMTLSKKAFEIKGQLFCDRDDPKPLDQARWVEFYLINPDRKRCFWPVQPARSVPDNEGRFTATLFEKGLYRVRIKNNPPQLDEFIPVDAVIPPVDCEVYLQIDGPEKNMRIEIPENFFFFLVVSDWTDKLPGNHTLKAIPRDLPGLYAPDRVTYFTPTPDGRFEFEGIAAGNYDFFLEVNNYGKDKDPLGMQVWENIKIQKQDDPQYIELKTEPTHSLKIEAAIEGDNPVYAKYMLIRGGNLRTCRKGLLRLNDPGHPGLARLNIALPEDDYTLYIAPSDPDRSVFVQQFHVDSKQTLSYRIGEAGQVMVQLKGNDIAGHTIRVFSADGSRSIPRLTDPMFCADNALLPFIILPTDPTGRTNIYGLEPGEYMLQVEGTEKKTKVKVLPRETANIEIALP